MSHSASLQAARRIFEELTDLASEAREEELQARCGGDTALATLVRELLASHDAIADSTLKPAACLLDEAIEAHTRLEVGEILGHWRIEALIGRGGMGAVYRVSRSDGAVAQTAALKLIRRELLDEATRARFHRERQIVADLDHPNIARLIDAGERQGAPYYVMEYIPGVAVTTYCNERRLPIEARLALFRTILDAVGYAHQRLIIHRDLKPANVMVGEDGVPKIVDFGIATPLSEQAEASASEQLVLSPHYAAPEQFLGDTVTTACDIYGLGALLYELLCGQRPLRFQGSVLSAMRQAVLEQTPRPPSQQEGSDPAASQRGLADARALGRRLRGDLDAICLRALEKAPGDRYASTTELAADIDAHRDHRPVISREIGWMGRFGRLVRRNRLVTAVTAVALVSAVAFTVGLYRQSIRLAAERDRAEQVTEFLVETFRSADPTQTLGETVTAREVLDRAAQRLQSELQDQPELRSELVQTIVDVQLTLGLYPQAEALLEVPSRPAEAMDLEQGRLRARLLHATARYDEALAEIDRVMSLSDGPLDRADALELRAHTLSSLDHREEGLAHYREAHALRTEHLGADHRSSLRAERSIIRTLSSLGLNDEALSQLHDFLPRLRGAYPPSHPDVASTLHLASYMERRARNYEQAMDHALEAETIYRRAYGDDHLVLASLLNSMGSIERKLDNAEGAAEHYRRSLAIHRQYFGDADPRVAMTRYNLAVLLYRDLGQYPEAREHFGAAVASGEALWGDGHTNVNIFRLGYATLLNDLGELDQAEVLLRKAMAAFESIESVSGVNLASVQAALGAVLAKKGHVTEARELLDMSLPILRREFGDDDIDVKRAVAALTLLAPSGN